MNTVPMELTAMKPTMAWANFGKIVFYGWGSWPSACEWIVPGTITDLDRFGG